MSFLLWVIIALGALMFLSQFFKALARGSATITRYLPVTQRVTFPHILNTSLLTVGGSQRAAKIRVDPDVVYITIERSETDLVAIPVDSIFGVIYQDLSKSGYPMAGLGIVTTDGRYEFFSQSLFAPQNMKKTADVIRDCYQAVTGHSLPYSDPNEEILHAR